MDQILVKYNGNSVLLHPLVNYEDRTGRFSQTSQTYSQSSLAIAKTHKILKRLAMERLCKSQRFIDIFIFIGLAVLKLCEENRLKHLNHGG